MRSSILTASYFRLMRDDAIAFTHSGEPLINILSFFCLCSIYKTLSYGLEVLNLRHTPRKFEHLEPIDYYQSYLLIEKLFFVSSWYKGEIIST